MESSDWAVCEVIAGMLLFQIPTAGFLALSFGFADPVTLGFLLGSLGAVALFLSMADSTAKSVETMTERGGRAMALRGAAGRYTALILGALILSRIPQISVVTALLAVLTIKTGLYLQPFLHKRYCEKFDLFEPAPRSMICEDAEDEEEDEERIVAPETAENGEDTSR